MKLNELTYTEGSRSNRKRIGRGQGSGTGKTSGKGNKGQNARSGGGVAIGFEGGQTPFFKRMPKRGFTNYTRKEYAIVNVEDLNKFEDGVTVDYEALKAADQLVSRYRPEGKYIQAWGEMWARDNARLIIDCMLNVPLLYWASEETKDGHYADIAKNHILTTMKHVIRDDDSTWHTIFFDPDSGEFSHGATCQGYKDASAWARGQAWGIYGTAIAYKNTGDPEYIKYFERVSRYFLSHLPKDLCPYWDLCFGDGDEAEQPRDSSSAAIAICGFLEMSKYLDEEKSAYYTSVAKKLMHSLIENYQVKNKSVSNGQLLHGTYARKTPFNTCKNRGVDECVIWGDYFFMEALTRLARPDWKIYW